MPLGVVVACLTLEVGFGVAGERLEVFGVREDDGSTVVHLHLAVLAVDSRSPVDVYMREPRGHYLAWAYVGEDDDSMVGVDDVDAARCGKGLGRCDGVVNVGCEADG